MDWQAGNEGSGEMDGQTRQHDEDEQNNLACADASGIRVHDPLIKFVDSPNDEKNRPVNTEPTENLLPEPDEGETEDVGNEQ